MGEGINLSTVHISNFILFSPVVIIKCEYLKETVGLVRQLTLSNFAFVKGDKAALRKTQDDRYQQSDSVFKEIKALHPAAIFDPVFFSLATHTLMNRRAPLRSLGAIPSFRRLRIRKNSTLKCLAFSS